MGPKRHVVANNKYLETFDETKPSNYIRYEDANNLYAWAMVQSLPFANLKIDNTIDIKDILNTADNDDVGYIVECDLKSPKEIHDKLKEYPPCPENICAKVEWMSDFQKQLYWMDGVRIGCLG